MKKLLSLFLMLQAMWLSAQQKCPLKYVYHVDSLQNQGIVKLAVTNIGSKKIKINKSFSAYRMQLVDIHEKSPNSGTAIKHTADVDCIDCIKKTKKLKPGQTYTYSIPIKETIQYRDLIFGKTYRFKLWFDLIDMTPENCFKHDFTSDEIIYERISR